MPLSSIFKRKKPDSPDPGPASLPLPEDAGPVQEARVRARRRLIGAVVLLGAGVIVFPLLFETQPRPLPVDIPIELPRREGAASVAAPRSPPARPPAAAEPVPEPVAEAAAPASAVQVAETASAARAPEPAPVAAPRPAPVPPAAASARAPAAKASVAAPAAAVARPAAPASRSDDGKRAQALLEERPKAAAAASVAAAASEPGAGRFVVQVGAYTDTAALREARQKVEKLGLKTYTQVIETDKGKRTRVRVGPFATRLEAEQASTRLKAAGLPGNLLVL